MLYSILKDDKPKNTVKRIQKIIKNLNINLEEIFYIDNDKSSPVSLRLTIKNNWFIGTNGKGTCRENALASAYAEFIERLQNLFLFDDYNNLVWILPDKVQVEKIIKYDNKNIKKYFQKKISAYLNLKDNKIIDDEFFLLPFYSVKEQKICNIPYNILARTKGSNGMAAGNTMEEAIVQGLSEVCERYALKKIFTKNLALPDIPEEQYLKYKNIKRIVKYFENNGYKIYVKDASLGGKIPVVCTIIEDKKYNIFCPSFGAHPSLAVAIERTLTEFTQGIMLSKFRKYNFIGYSYYSKEKLKYTNTKNIYKALFMHKIAFAKTKKLENIFFSDKFSYPFSKDTWIWENRTYTNKELLDTIFCKISKISDDIYIRNVSFLGFPTVDIFIPDITDLADYNKEIITNRMLDIYWSVYNNNPDKKSYTINSLLKLAETFSFTETLTSTKVFQVPFEYIAFLCSLVLKDSIRIIKYINILLEQNKIQCNYDENQILTLKIIKEYFNSLKNDKDNQYLIGKLSKKYKKEDINYAFEIINELTYEDVLDIVVKKNKFKKFRGKMLFKTLEKKYKKNLPSQMIFKTMFTT